RREFSIPATPKPKYSRVPSNNQRPARTVTIPKSHNNQIGEPYRSMTPQSPTLLNDPRPMYAPLAIKQKPAKNRKKLVGSLAAANRPQVSTGATPPTSGPAHTTTIGCGFGSTSVREIVSG